MPRSRRKAGTALTGHSTCAGHVRRHVGCSVDEHAEGRRSSAYFDVAWYLAHHRDVQEAFGAGNYAGARHHWLNYGINEGRQSSPAFDVAYYVEANPDIKAAFGRDFAAAFKH